MKLHSVNNPAIAPRLSIPHANLRLLIWNLTLLSTLIFSHIAVAEISQTSVDFNFNTLPPANDNRVAMLFSPHEPPVPEIKPEPTPAKANETDPKAEDKKDTKPEESKAVDKTGDKKVTDKLADKKKPAPKNPVANILRGIFGNPGRAQNKTQIEEPLDEEMKNAKGDTASRDEYDERAPFEREAANLLVTIRKQTEENDLKNSLPLIQQILNSDDNSVIRNESGDYHSLRWEAQEILAKAPPEIKQEYQREYSQIAERLLHDAESSGQVEDLAKVAQRYFHTPAGYEAANRIANFHFDRGDFVLAHLWLGRLLSSEAPFTKTPEWQLRLHQLTQSLMNQQASTASEPKSKTTTTPKKSVATTNTPMSIEPPDTNVPQQVKPETADENGVIDKNAATPDNLIDTWMKQTRKFLNNTEWEVTDWKYAYGVPGRNGYQPDRTPLLLNRWHHLLIHDPSVKIYMDHFLEEVEISGTTAIPAQMVIKVGSTVISRTLAGLIAIDIETGKILWEKFEELSPEQLLSGKPISLSNAFPDMKRNSISNWGQPTNGTGIEARPSGQMLFTDGNYGQISSDGQNVYTLQDLVYLAPLENAYYWGAGSDNSLAKQDPFRRDWSSNRLISYDIHTGELRWMVGGRKLNESFDLELAGTFFFGTPLPIGDRVYITGEDDGEVRLYALDSSDGTVLWSQLLNYVEFKIPHDSSRRFAASPLTCSQGILFCATNQGWMTAVDLTSHDIVWCQRYEPISSDHKANYRMRFDRYQYQKFSHSWLSEPPLVIDDTVIFFPHEKQEYYAVDIHSGRIKWRHPKSNAIYPAGVHHQHLIMVNDDSIESIEPSKGHSTWKVKYLSQLEKVCGRGILTKSHLILPFQDSVLAMIDLNTDEHQITISNQAESVNNLGNLIFADDVLISLTPNSITAFEEIEPTEEKIQQRLKITPNDSWTRLTKSRIELLSKKYAEALQTIQGIQSEDLLPKDQAKYQEMMWLVLYEMTRQNLQDHDAEFQQLAQFCTSPEKKNQYDLLNAERLVAHKEPIQAFEVLVSMLSPQQQALITDFYDADLEISFSMYVSGRLLDLWTKADDSQRAAYHKIVAQKLERFLQQKDDSNAAELSYWLEVFAFHPLADELAWQMTKSAARNLAYTEFDYYAHQVKLTPQRKFELLIDRAELLYKLGMADDAQQLCHSFYDQSLQIADISTIQFSKDLPTKVDWSDEQKQELFKKLSADSPPELQQRFLQLQSSLEHARAYASWNKHWHGEKYTVRRMMGDHFGHNQTERLYEVINGNTPFLNQHPLTYDYPSNTLKITDLQGNPYCSLPLRTGVSTPAEAGMTICHKNHLLTCLSRGALHLISIPERKVIWSQPLQMDGITSQYIRTVAPNDATRLIRMQQILSAYSWHNEDKRMGSLAGFTSRVICYHGFREIIAVDALTGQTRWIRRRLPQVFRVNGDNDMVTILAVDNDGQEVAIVVDPMTGQKCAEPSKIVNSMRSQLCTITDNGLLTISTKAALANAPNVVANTAKNNLEIKMTDTATGDTRWSFITDLKTYGSIVDDRYLILLEPDSPVIVVDITTGIKTVYGTTETNFTKNIRECYAIMQGDTLYLMMNKNSNSNYYYMGIRSIRVNGDVVCFKAHHNKYQWKQAIDGGFFVIRDWLHAPAMAFLMMKSVNDDDLYYHELTIKMFDKETGENLMDQKLITQDSVQRSELNLADGYWEFSTYNMRARVMPQSTSRSLKQELEKFRESMKPKTTTAP
jgi:outer membrane protein assembly factor BamB